MSINAIKTRIKRKKTWIDVVRVPAVRTHLVACINRFGAQFNIFKRGQTSYAYAPLDHSMQDAR